ncbi:MAG: hypothetical protein ACR2L2_07300 [Acidobacteriota bacterium]
MVPKAIAGLLLVSLLTIHGADLYAAVSVFLPDCAAAKRPSCCQTAASGASAAQACCATSCGDEPHPSAFSNPVCAFRGVDAAATAAVSLEPFVQDGFGVVDAAPVIQSGASRVVLNSAFQI